jgi:hypothetical protein
LRTSAGKLAVVTACTEAFMRTAIGTLGDEINRISA